MAVSLAEFADRITEVMPVVAREFIRQRPDELCRGLVTPPQFLVLNYLETRGELKMTDLAKLIGVTTAAMTGVVDRIVRRRYAERVFEPTDRRVIKMRPTAKGLALVKKIKEQKKEMVIKLFGRLPQQDREEYLRIITKIRDILARERS